MKAERVCVFLRSHSRLRTRTENKRPVICISCMLSEGFGAGGVGDMREYKKRDRKKPHIVEAQKERGGLNEAEGEN